MNWRITQIDTESAVLMLDCPGLCWDNFPTLAEALLQEWELESVERDWGADRHDWRVVFEGSPLRLEFEHHSGCWLSAVHPADRDVVLWLGRQHQA
ncbi:DUF3630 family protein [Aeromonas lusitana]|uniref:DUF3630 domain-containing protein n=1 Tax=Aeromonas lusitana TaxID=931529 RepID=A0A2M8H9A2_9GAMM|nr:DUF3630 family protein [Aeromonas lusitana]PJC93146.1 DUF3630 domain-containing protein [Aeromonas lusitana]